METAMRPQSSMPIAMPHKAHAHAHAQAHANLYPISRVAAGSPPEVSDISTTTGSTIGEFDSSSSSGAYAGVDIIDTLHDRMNNVFDPSRLDKGVAKQAQMSGQLNAKQRELLELQAIMQRRIKGARTNFAEGIKAAKETKSDLEWTQKRVINMKTKAERTLPSEYNRASSKYAYDEEY